MCWGWGRACQRVCLRRSARPTTSQSHTLGVCVCCWHCMLVVCSSSRQQKLTSHVVFWGTKGGDERLASLRPTQTAGCERQRMCGCNNKDKLIKMCVSGGTPRPPLRALRACRHARRDANLPLAAHTELLEPGHPGAVARGDGNNKHHSACGCEKPLARASIAPNAHRLFDPCPTPSRGVQLFRCGAEGGASSHYYIKCECYSSLSRPLFRARVRARRTGNTPQVLLPPRPQPPQNSRVPNALHRKRFDRIATLDHKISILFLC